MSDISEKLEGLKVDDLSASFQSLLDKVVEAKRAPGVSVVAFNSDKIVASAFAGVRDVDSKQPWSEDTVFWPASMGKSAASIVVLAVASDLGVGLDDHEALLKHLPEFDPKKNGILARKLAGWDTSEGSEKRKMILEDWPEGAQKVTLRLLLDHTYGMGYFFNDEKTAQAYTPADAGAKAPMLSGIIDSVTIPPVNEPGTKWMYGNQADWAALWAVRASGKTMRLLAKEKISDKLGLTPEEFGTWITPKMEENMATVHANIAPETFVPTPIRVTQYEDVPPEGFAVLGSAPFYATIRGFARVLQAYLKPDGDGLLPASLFKQAIADSLAPRKIAVPTPVLTSSDLATSYSVDVYSKAAASLQQELGWTCIQTIFERAESETGRSKGTLSWSGLANGHFLVDREKGVGLLVNAHFLPFADTAILDLRDDLERALYSSLKN